MGFPAERQFTALLGAYVCCAPERAGRTRATLSPAFPQVMRARRRGMRPARASTTHRHLTAPGIARRSRA